MANEFVDLLRPSDFTKQNGGPVSTYDWATSGVVSGLRLIKGDTKGFTALIVINAEHTMGTGLTFEVGLVDDGKDANDLSKVVRIGITPKLITGGTDTLDFTGAATETTADVTLDASAGQMVAGSIAVATAALDSAVVGSRVLIRVRRIGNHANDTCKNAVILTYLYIRNT